MTYVAMLLFLVFAGLTVLGAWAIVFSRNIVRMAIYLLLTLGGVAGLYLMLSAQFPAAIQLIVYAGGTLILIIFGVMLTSRSSRKTLFVSKLQRVSAGLLGVAMAVLLAMAALWSPLDVTSADISQQQAGAAEPEIVDIGMALLTDYLVPFEVAAVLLLVVMVAAAYMARRRADGPEAQVTEE